MNWTDGVLVLLLAAFVVHGVMIGLVRQLAGMAGLLLGLALALLLFRPLAFWLVRATRWRINPEATAFLILFLGIWVATNLAAFAYRPHPQGKDRDADWADALSGGAFGLLSGALMLSVLVAGTVWLEMPVGRALSVSPVGAWLLRVAAAVAQMLSRWLPLPWPG